MPVPPKATGKQNQCPCRTLHSALLLPPSSLPFPLRLQTSLQACSLQKAQPLSYLIMTTITMICATAFPKVFNDAPGANEIGTFLIYIFFAVIGAPASIMSIITQAPLLLVYALIIVACNMLITLIFGKIFKFSLEEIILASNANIGGPTTAAAMAISKGWNKLVGPVLLIGTLGYVLGNYYGVLVGNLLR